MTKRIAIIGTGISGLTCAHLLADKHEVSVFEANDYIGGHTATVDVEVGQRKYAIDTGFIVYNDWTYPNFIKLMKKLNVATQPTEMSFSVKNKQRNFEYNGNNINSLFAQRRNILSPRFWFFIKEILRFNKVCKAIPVNETSVPNSQTLSDFLREHNFSEFFSHNYILPMCAAIWSTSVSDTGNFPLQFFLQFFNNHGLLNVTDRPQWHTIIGGSRSYIEPLTRNFADQIHLNSPVTLVQKTGDSFLLTVGMDENTRQESFDEVIFACHSDQALAMLAQPTNQQTEILGALRYAPNEVVLHTDTSLLPKRKLAWASWNYLINDALEDSSKPASVTYNMNILQNIQSDTTFCVTLNNKAAIDESKILRVFNYSHPQVDLASIAAQKKREQICGVDGMHFAGAYWYNGFHEDGMRSALDVCKRFGATL
ncbi:FAD-dependent oxidoreductase [Alteromonadaceae bacterium M269]|nr:FAD-dependent oxidoreductase [Alteromonadaceae bacterium M269]